jgi:hypothetical protein
MRGNNKMAVMVAVVRLATYALSLSFFESILLRPLRQVGCQEIWVITDVQGYRDSLMNREQRPLPLAAINDIKNGETHIDCRMSTIAHLWLLLNSTQGP